MSTTWDHAIQYRTTRVVEADTGEPRVTGSNNDESRSEIDSNNPRVVGSVTDDPRRKPEENQVLQLEHPFSLPLKLNDDTEINVKG